MHFARSGFQSLVDIHYEGLYRYAYRLSGSSADAEDLTQETFGKAISRLDQLREPERAKAWLFRILRNLYLHQVRSEKRHRVVPLESIADLPSRETDAEPPLVDPAKLQEALNELEEGFRTPLILFYFDDFSYRDIADQMELPIGTVMSRLARAKSYLKAKLCSSSGRGSDAPGAPGAPCATDADELTHQPGHSVSHQTAALEKTHETTPDTSPKTTPEKLIESNARAKEVTDVVS